MRVREAPPSPSGSHTYTHTQTHSYTHARFLYRYVPDNIGRKRTLFPVLERDEYI
jgi:hypothetical protein